jgi:hypothetical protein
MLLKFPEMARRSSISNENVLPLGHDAVEAFDEPEKHINQNYKRTEKVPVENRWRRLSQQSFTSNSDLRSPTSSFESSLEAFPMLYDEPQPPKPKVTEDDILRIKAAISKGRQRALENIKRGCQGVRPLSWRISGCIEEWVDTDDSREELYPNDSPSEFEDDTFEVRSIYSNPRERFAFEVAPAHIVVTDGPSKVSFTREDIKYRKKVNSRRISKIKELLLDDLATKYPDLEDLAVELKKATIRGETEKVDMLLESSGININPDPTLSELVQFKTPSSSARFQEDSKPTADNPFTSLVSRALHPQRQELAQPIDEYEEDVDAFRGPPQLVETRFKIHDLIQGWLKETSTQWKKKKGYDLLAADVVKFCIGEVEDLVMEQKGVDEDHLLDGEEVPEERKAAACPVDMHHFSLSYLTAWLERCEKNGW